MATLKSLKIRMYRGILGDCFLLRATVDDDGTEAIRSILIDCGVLQNVASGADMIAKLDAAVVTKVGKDRLEAVIAGPDRISAVAKNVLQEVNGRIDLLIITHEHFDHLSGFAVEKEGFLDKGLTIDRLWMAWTEDPRDDQANALRARLSKGKQALAAAAALANSPGFAAPAGLQNAAALAAFVGPVTVPGMGISGGLGTADILRMLKDKAGAAATSYFEPGQVIDLDRFGIRTFVLGPPRDEKLLRKDTPSGGPAKEVYLTRQDAAAAAMSTARAQLALHGLMDRTETSIDDGLPFALIHRRRITKKDRRNKDGPLASTQHAVRKLYDDDSQSWRRIDGDWAGSVEALAMKMDSDTNNTSLALAFELPDGQVLLFPGDAQVGNWLSWDDQTYPPKATQGSTRTPVTADDLLRRVTFYKAGHHGSHNATLKALGLERMTDPRLCAAIPVVEAVAAVQGKGRKNPGAGWAMPFGAFYVDLEKRTMGRIVQGDGDPNTEKQAFAKHPTATLHPVTVEHDDLWVELTFTLA